MCKLHNVSIGSTFKLLLKGFDVMQIFKLWETCVSQIVCANSVSCINPIACVTHVKKSMMGIFSHRRRHPARGAELAAAAPNRQSSRRRFSFRDLIEVGVNVTVSRKKRNFRRRLSQYAQRAGSARKLLQCVLNRAMWPHLCFGNRKLCQINKIKFIQQKFKSSIPSSAVETLER